MPTVSIISPFSGETGYLLGDFYQAVEHVDQLIIVDNACPHATATALVEMTTHLSGEYIRNKQNQGFAAANNQGYARASGDIIIFLNSDVAPAGPWLEQVAKDVKDGALYGPSLASQLVAGRHIPYLEGWCIAATRGTWERLSRGFVMSDTGIPGRSARAGLAGHLAGPWDALSCPGPYWEDNKLCLDALCLGIALIQTAWPIQHKGGATAGPIIRHAESFARNERTFTERVLQVLKQPNMSPLWQRYMAAYHTPSDINHHIGLLYSLARGNVVELGTRTGVSTAALLAGVEARGGHVWSVDVAECGALFDSELWTFIQGDSADEKTVDRWWCEHPQPMPHGDTVGLIDLLLIDTNHTFEQATAELSLWSTWMRPGGHILLHDPETFPGVRRAVMDFCASRNWSVTWVLPNNGMAVVEVPRG